MRFLVLLLTHQDSTAVRRMVDWWKGKMPGAQIVVAYGGSREGFDSLDVEDAYFVDDPELRTRDHPRERQSYLGVMRGALPFIDSGAPDWVYLAEYDEVPLAEDFSERLMANVEHEDADVLGHDLFRVDGTSNSHYLAHAYDPGFIEFWKGVSVRENRSMVLSMLGCGSLWRASAFREIALLKPPLRIYLELYLPTAAHHLGYRVRPYGMDGRLMHPSHEKSRGDVERELEAGSWCIHPCKEFWLYGG